MTSDNAQRGGSDHMMPLGLLSTGDRAEVLEIREKIARRPCPVDAPEPGNDAHLCRMEEMGMRIGKTVEMLNNEGRGAMLVKIDESRIAIGRGMAMKIMVRRNV